MKNIQALYKSILEIRRQIKESESLKPIAEEQLNSRTRIVEAARKAVEDLAMRGNSSADSVARQYIAKTHLDEAIAGQEPFAKDLATLLGTLDRLHASERDAKAELLLRTDEVISEITRSHEISIDKNQRQMMLDIYSAGVLSRYIQLHGVVAFSEQDLSAPLDWTDWHSVVEQFFKKALPEPSRDELQAALVAFKKRSGFSSIGK